MEQLPLISATSPTSRPILGPVVSAGSTGYERLFLRGDTDE